MRLRSRPILAFALAWQQLLFNIPVQALVNAPTGLPVDGAVLATQVAAGNNAQNVRTDAGESAHRLPILAPPGTGGLTPRVALAYTSGASRRNEALGVGWRLDIGPQVIERSTRDGAPEFDDTDTYELAGQRLKETGTPGRYVTEIDSFQRIEHVSDNESDYWIVSRPDGTRLYFGFHPGTDWETGSILSSDRVHATDPTSGVCSNPHLSCVDRERIIEWQSPFAWYLDRIEDRNGNIIRLTWESLGDAGVRYLTAISYSGHVSGAVNTVPGFGGPDDGSLATTREILFSYEQTRGDAVPRYRTGFARQFTHRLDQIEVQVDEAPVRLYHLAYEKSPASGRSRLRSFTERNAENNAANERVTSFTYGDGGVPPGGSYWSARQTQWALPNGLTFVSSGEDKGIRLVDVNTDGYPDVVQADGSDRKTFLGGPDGWASASATGTWALPRPVVAGNGYRGVVFPDFDGDGRRDLWERLIEITGVNTHNESCGSSSTNVHHEVVTNSQGSFEENEARLNNGAGWTVAENHTPGSTRYTSTPLATIGSADACPYEYFPLASRVSGVDRGFDQGVRLADLNGDGRDDIVAYRALNGARVVNTTLYHVDETRAGSLLNSDAGFSASTPNINHFSVTRTWNSFAGNNPILLSEVVHRRFYDSPRWQVPDYTTWDGGTWSVLNTCKAYQN